MRTAPRFLALGAVLAAAASLGGAFALGQGGGGVSSSEPAGVGPGAIVTPPSTAPMQGGAPKGTLGEQTHPAALPRLGGPQTRFRVRLTLPAASRHAGAVATGYHLRLTVPAGKPIQRCSPGAPATISGNAHDLVRVELVPPAGGWCAGRYAVTVLLQRGPSCPKPLAGRLPRPCPEFADQELSVGTAHFVVAAKH